MGAMSSVFLFLLILAGTCLAVKLEERLQILRNAMKSSKLDGYIIPNSDYHLSEVPMERDKIREWFTGFRGSSGNGALTIEEAALWTDSRYTIQAKKQLGNGWSLAEKDKTISKWLSEKLSPGQSVGADPKRMSFKSWLKIEKELSEKRIKLVSAEEFTSLWQNRPGFPEKKIFIHENIYNGQSHDLKLKRYREKLSEKNCTIGLITSLDEVSWLLNLRGGDISDTPIFAAFAIVSLSKAVLYTRSQIVTDAVVKHLNSSKSVVNIKEYDEFWNDWKDIASTEESILVPNSASYFVYSAVPEAKRKNGSSPIIDMRAYKTATEVNASREAHTYDGIAFCRLFRILEKEISEDHNSYNDTDISKLITKLRTELPLEYFGPSFPDIVASGVNGALPHYIPELGQEAEVNSSTLMYIDSGGQYQGGTTDTTRTLHFGQPRSIEIEVYTRLLKGVARLGGMVFPEGAKSNVLDSLLRAPLYEVGLDYGHGSTHGIGIFSSVHESYNGTYYENFIGSQEPGYYEENNFGMRLENAIVVVPAEIKYKGKVDKKFLKFSPLTLVPYEQKLIDPSIMDESEIKWVNNYHKEVLNKVGRKLITLQDQETYDWLVKKTQPIKNRLF